MRILVVEDEKRVAAAVRRGLEAEGFAVDVALTGTDGQWLAEENTYDVIVLDIMLPRAGGLRAWVSGSRTNYDHWRGEGEIQKTQFNTRVYQPLSNGDLRQS